jgi:hypothetical protein
MDLVEQQPYDGREAGEYWREQLGDAKSSLEDWTKKGEKVVKRYRDERQMTDGLIKKFNILWANVELLQPSLYGRMPKPEVSRRFNDQDKAGRLASTILERVIGYEVEQFPDFNAAMSAAVQDRLLPGRGIAWVRYEPVIEQVQFAPEPGVMIQAEAGEQEAQISGAVEDPQERIVDCHAPVDYVYWKDFSHSPARTWAEVWWVGRRVYMTRQEGIERFGPAFANVPLNKQNTDQDSKQTEKSKNRGEMKAAVWEIWNKNTGRVCWVADGYGVALDEREDPLGLEGFFPCPEPLYANLTNGSLVPIPDYLEYQDQAAELDSLTNRISMLVKAIKAVGIFNGEFKSLQRLFTEGYDNTMIPVQNWGAMSEKGGLKGAIDMLDISPMAAALQQLYVAREQTKQTIYEITGISDVLRGASDANETLGAQQLKANFGNLRLKQSQGDVARFASDLFRLKAQIICRFYPPELLVAMSGVDKTTDGQVPGMLEAAIQMLKDSKIRDFHITVESDTLAQIDEVGEKQAAEDAIGAIAKFLQQAVPMVGSAPETLPMVSEMLLFLVRRFRAGRALEGAIEQTMQLLQQKAQQGGMSQPDHKSQADQMRAQADIQIQQHKSSSDAQVAQARAQFDVQKHQLQLQYDGQMEAARQQFERWKAELESRTRITVAEIQARASTIPQPRPVETITQ